MIRSDKIKKDKERKDNKRKIITNRVETHPFGIFVPPGANYLLLGSFTTKEAYNDETKAAYDWFYSNGRNKFWPILSEVYARPLQLLSQKQALFTDLRMGLGDIIWQCERQLNSNLDMNLVNIVYNTKEVARVLKENDIKKIYFSSRFVENKFRINFKAILEDNNHLQLVTLPSPSPRYAAMKISDKIAKYKELLPKL